MAIEVVPFAPPPVHPLWQGSISSKWMDPGNGRPRARTSLAGHLRDGVGGISDLGLGGFMTDTQGKLQRDVSMAKGKTLSPSQLRESREPQWRPCWRISTPPTVKEPAKISQRPPFLSKKGSTVTSKLTESLAMDFDPVMERFKVEAARKEYQRGQRAVLEEEWNARNMVLGLEAWEQDHLTRKAAITNQIQNLRHDKTSAVVYALSAASTTARRTPPMWRSSSDTKLEFCRNQFR